MYVCMVIYLYFLCSKFSQVIFFRNTMLLHQLKVVTWKNLIIRKRHWFLTILEGILPVCLFFLIAYGRSKIPGLKKVEVPEPTYCPLEPIYNSISLGDFYFLYTPNNKLYTNVINRLQEKLGIHGDQVKGFDTEEELMDFYYSKGNYTTSAIIFNDKDPKKLNYRIRYHKPNYNDEFLWTYRKYVDNFSFQPCTGGVYSRSDFIPIQQALDISFIEYNLNVDKTEDELSNQLTIFTKEFPYPPHNVNSAITTLFLDFLPLITLFSFIFICPAVLKRVVEEKHTGIKELMKMVGMKSWMLWLGWFIYGIIPMITAVIFIVLLMKIKMFGSDYPLIEHSDGGIMFFFLILYCLAAIAFCFAISSFFNKPTIALVTGILIWILSFFVPKYALGLDTSNQLSWSISVLLNLLPNMALHFGYSVISVFEQREIGIHWNNFYKSGSGGTEDITMLNIYLMLIFDIIFYTLFAFYMDGVNPGKFGVRKSFLFPFKNLFKFLRASNQDNEAVWLQSVEKGLGLEKGIEINNLYKRYGPKVAVDNLNLDIYKNQITVLLGHNGAGKSTTMSMITGMIEATSGSIKINGLDVKINMDEIRHSLGLCPQHNLLFNDLTVKEHLLFFAKLKGLASSKANKDVDELLEKLNMMEKKNSLAHTLSGGMQRKLCLGMALIGNSKVLILDEPSSGMDPESRRHLWDLLLKWRGEKTILITTHFMEEADALGDWIAIMSHGKLKCYGTPLYLKKQYDTGYHLSLMINCESSTERQALIAKIKAKVINHVPAAKLKSNHGNNIVFVLPFNKNQEMSKLLESLEEEKVNLNIDNISVTITTLEDVFLKTRDDDRISRSSSVDTQGENTEKNFNRTTSTLFKKKLQFLIKKKNAFIVPIGVAFIFFCLTGYLCRNGDNYSSNGPELKLNLNSYGRTSVFYNGTIDNSRITSMLNVYKERVKADKSLPFETKDVEQAILNKSIENIAYYNGHMIAGAMFDSVQLVALYNTMSLHSMPISINLITDSLAKALLGPDYSISISNWPLPSIKDIISPQEYSEAKMAILWLIMLPVGCLFIHGSLIIFPFTEISTKFIRLQYMCGVKPSSYWLVSFFTDLVLYMLLIIPMALILWIITPVLTTGPEFGYLLLIFFLYGMAGIPFAYLFSRKKTVSGAFALFIIMGLFLGIILTLVIGILVESQDEYYISIGIKLKYFCFLFIPQVGLCDGLVKFIRRAINIYNYEINPRKHQSYPCYIENSKECADFKNYMNLFNEHLLLLGGCVIYILINIMLDTYWLMKIWSKARYHIYNIIKGTKHQLQLKQSNDDNNRAGNSLKANHLIKNYYGKQIVKDISITLEKGHCLGILGVNGAGKTTTFRMLTREEPVDEGSIMIKSGMENIDIGDDQYMEKLGYCPQADTLNFVLTGRQILTTIANLRGEHDPKEVDRFLQLFELEEYADMPCGYYSGGNKRKLSLAVSLIGDPKFVLLDEPTNGVDPFSRRKCWELLKTMQQTRNLSFILTSHSMTECEALCNELRIMKDGVFVESGKLSELKNKHGGFSLKIKLCNKENSNNIISEDISEVDGPQSIPQNRFSNIDKLRQHFTKDDRGELKDEHSGLLHFYIKEKEKTWSKIFKEVEDIKIHNPHLIEDYAISEASLEDIFLMVARRTEDNNEGS